jgi:hypothetical protein
MYMKYLISSSVVLFIITVLAIGYSNTLEVKYQKAKSDVSEAISKITTLEQDSSAKIERAKDKIVDSLAKDCETKGTQEPDGAIILDSNNQMSIGAWMWQIKSIQHYVQKFEGRNITRVEAIRIAIDHEQAKALAKRVIFEEPDGVSNWANCAKKLQLYPKIEMVKDFEKA